MHLVGADCRCCASSSRQHQTGDWPGRAPAPLSLLPPSSPAQDKADADTTAGAIRQNVRQSIKGDLSRETAMPWGGNTSTGRASATVSAGKQQHLEARTGCQAEHRRMCAAILRHACPPRGSSSGAGPGLSPPEPGRRHPAKPTEPQHS